MASSTNEGSEFVAVCIPTFNQCQYLGSAILSALKQTYPYIQIWVSDDCSSDGTRQVMEEFCKGHPEIYYHRQEKNLGIARNCNWLLSQPNCQFLVRLDSDDELYPEYVETLVKAMKRYPQAGYAHTAVQRIDYRGNPVDTCYLARLEEYHEPEMALRDSLKGYKTACGNILMFRAEALYRLKFFEPQAEYVEDYELSIRMADEGFGNVYTGRVLANYRIWTDDVKNRLKRLRLQLRGYIYIFDHTFKQAFERHQWSTDALTKARRRFALLRAASCLDAIYNEDEQKELLSLLLQLGDSPMLRFNLRARGVGFGFMFDLPEQLVDRVRRLAKWLLNNNYNRPGRSVHRSNMR